MRRRLNGGNIAYPRKRQVQRARNGRRRHGKTIDVALIILDFLLMLDAEPLFLVENEQTQIAKFYVFGEKAVRTDDKVDLAAL